jgi:hypothetical protein
LGQGGKDHKSGTHGWNADGEENRKPWAQKIKESDAYYQKDTFGKFLVLDEGLQGYQEEKYEDTKNRFYKLGTNGPQPNEYFFDISGKDILTEQLFENHDLFSFVAAVI